MAKKHCNVPLSLLEPKGPTMALAFYRLVVFFALRGGLTYIYPMTKTLIGYARCSTDKQDLAAQQAMLEELGVAPRVIAS